MFGTRRVIDIYIKLDDLPSYVSYIVLAKLRIKTLAFLNLEGTRIITFSSPVLSIKAFMLKILIQLSYYDTDK